MALLVEPESFQDGYAAFTVLETVIWWNDLYSGDWWSSSSGVVRATEEEDDTFYQQLENGGIGEEPTVEEEYPGSHFRPILFGKGGGKPSHKKMKGWKGKAKSKGK